MSTHAPAHQLQRDRFGNAFSPGLPYARGRILSTGEDEHVKLREARRHMRMWLDEGGLRKLFNVSGLERGMALAEDEIYDDELSPALYEERLTRLALEHLGGDPDTHDVLLCNRQSAALFAALMVLGKPGTTIVGISADYTHPSITRPASLLGAHFIDTTDIESYRATLNRSEEVSLVVLTRLAVSYQLMSIEDVEQVTRLARARNVPILVDDAGGARVGPAVFGQPRLLSLDIDIGSTGLDKYGTVGPRLGLLGGQKDLVAAIKARAFEYGLEARPMLYSAVARSLEQYTEDRVRELAASTSALGTALDAVFGRHVTRTPVSVKLQADDLLELALVRAGLLEPPIVPYEATAAVAMVLLRDYGVMSVHFAGLPPGTSALLFKFTPPEVLQRFGGPEKLARAINASIDQVSEMLHEPESIRQLLLGQGV